MLLVVGVPVMVGKDHALEVYLPILAELENFGIHFNEIQMPYIGYNPDKVSH